MVLNQLGSKLSSVLSRLSYSSEVDEETLKGLLQEITQALLENDVNLTLVNQLKKNIQSKIKEDSKEYNANQGKFIEKAIVEELIKMLDPGKAPYKLKPGVPNVIMFVGLQGAGKTTTVAKYAHYYQQRGKKVAMVCADTFRAGAFDQLKQNATRVRVPFYGSYTEADPVKIASEGVALFRKERYDVIIVDTSGRHKQEAALFEEMEQVAAAVRPQDIVFVMDASIGQAAQSQAAAFRSSVPVGSVIITKLDGHSRGGGAISAVAATGSPIIFVGVGEHFDDLQPFDPRRFVSRLLGRGDLAGLAEDLSQLTTKPLPKGKMTYRTLRTQLQSLTKLGPLSKLVEKIPGMGQLASMPGMDKTFRGLIVLMDSMNADELDGVVPIDDARAIRIIRGSGRSPQDLRQLEMMLRQFEKMQAGVRSQAPGVPSLSEQQMLLAAKKNPRAVAEQLQRQDPGIIERMGGMNKAMELIKNVGKDKNNKGGLSGLIASYGGNALGGLGAGGDGMPDMAQMSKMMNMFGGGGGGMPDMAQMSKMMNMFGGAGAGGSGGMPDMAQMSKMMNMFGGGGAGGAGGGSGGMPDMSQMNELMKLFGGGK